MSINGKIHMLKTVATVLAVVTFFGSPIADPVITNMPPVFCFRITHIAADKTDAEGDRFIFLFESLNWSNQNAAGIYISLNEGTGAGGAIDNPPSFADAAIDPNGRPIGPDSDPPPGNDNNPNDWSVTTATATAVRWSAGTPIPRLDLVGSLSEGNPCDLVPGCRQEFDNSENTVFVIPNPETVDDSINVLDGFQFTVDDFDPGEILSFDWFLFDGSGNPIGTSALGNAYGFGTVNIVNTPGTGPVPGPVFTGNTGFSQSPNLFYDQVYIVPDPAIMAAEFGPSLTAAFVNPADNFFNAPVNTTLLPRSQPSQFPNSTGEITLVLPDGSVDTIMLTGSSAINYVVGANGEAVDADDNGRDEALTILEQLELTGSTTNKAPVTLRLRTTTASPFLRSHGVTEENDNNLPGIFELPPFAMAGPAFSTLNVYWELEVGGQILHSLIADRLETTISQVPPAIGETYTSFDFINLYDEAGNQSDYSLVDAKYTPSSTVLTCDLKIVSPLDGVSLCDNSVPVVATLTVMGGNPPYNDTTCTINGIPSEVQADGTLMALVPLIPGVNTILAECTVIDLGLKAAMKVPLKRFEETTCRDSVKIFSDPTPPTCTFDFTNLPIITGQAIDNESGIAAIEVIEVRNRIVTIDPFNPGDKVVGFSSDKIDPSLPSGFMLKITNVAGCDTICDPIYLRLSPTETPCHFTFALPHTDRYFYITNRGLERVFLTINGHELNLVASQSGSGRDGNTYFMPFDGLRAIDLHEFLITGENQFEVICQGGVGTYADLLILDFEMQDGTTAVDDANGAQSNLPTDFALGQNYPNPFNPSTRISFALAEAGVIELIVYDVQGNEVKTLASGSVTSGVHEVIWDGRNRTGEVVSAGTYFYRLLVQRNDGQAEVVLTKKMTFLK